MWVWCSYSQAWPKKLGFIQIESRKSNTSIDQKKHLHPKEVHFWDIERERDFYGAANTEHLNIKIYIKFKNT